MNLRTLARFEALAAALLSVRECWDVNVMSLYKQFSTFRRTSAPSSSVSALLDHEDEKHWEIITDWLILAFQKTSVFSVAFLSPAFLSVVFIFLYYRCFCPPALLPLLYLNIFEVSASTHLSLGDNDNGR